MRSKETKINPELLEDEVDRRWKGIVEPYTGGPDYLPRDLDAAYGTRRGAVDKGTNGGSEDCKMNFGEVLRV